MGQNQFVVPHNGSWAVRSANSSKVTKIFDKKSDAIAYGEQIAKNQQSELTALKKNGQINLKNSYGNDPRNIKG